MTLLNFFTKKSADTETRKAETNERSTSHYASAPGSEIRYSPTLVDELKNDHKNLVNLYLAIKTDFDNGNYQAVSAKLNQFRSGLQGHLLTENVRFYIYIDRVHGQDEMNSELIRGFRREMDGIGRAALNFLTKYEMIGVDKELASAFAADFAAIGAVLTERIRKEESVLYPLYTPVY